MKKSAVLYLGLLPLLLAGCSSGGASKISFEENTYKYIVSSEEALVVKSNVLATLKNLNSFSEEEITFSEYGHQKITTTEKNSVKLYTDYYYEYSNSTSEENTTNGITYSSSEKKEGSVFLYDEMLCKIDYADSDDNGTKSVDLTVTEYTSSNKKNMQNNFYENIGLYTNAYLSETMYKTSDGWAMVYSNIDENRSGVAFGNETNENVKITKYQIICEITKDYKIKSATYIKETKANRDPSTYEWWDDLKVYESYKHNLSCKYGKYTDGASKLNKMKQKCGGMYLESVSVQAVLGEIDNNNKFNITEILYPTTYVRRTGFNSYHCTVSFNVTFSDYKYAFRVYAIGTYYDTLKKLSGDSEEVDFEVSDPAVETYSDEDHKKVMIGDIGKSYRCTFEFDVAASKDGLKATLTGQSIY